MKSYIIRLGSVSLSALAGVGIAASQSPTSMLLIAGIALACGLPIAARVFSRRFDLFEPLVIANAALLVMYVARPLAMHLDGPSHFFKGYEITDRYDDALLVALVGVVALQVGYGLPWGTQIAGRLPVSRRSWDFHATFAFSLALGFVAAALFAVFLMQTGGLGLVFDLAQGRNAAYDVLYRRSSAYLYGAPQLVWPASLLLFAVGFAARRRDAVLGAIALTLCVAIFQGAQGSRITLIPLVFAPFVYWYLSRSRRPGPLVVGLAAYLLVTVGIAYVREARTATERIDRVQELRVAVTEPQREVDLLVSEGVDNDMFESLATEMVIVPSELPASPLDFAYRIIAKPIPAVLWRGKPSSPEEQLIQVLYPRERERASSSAGVIGSFFHAGLIPGVAIGMLLLGLALRVPWEYWRRSQREMTAMLFLTASLMFVPIVLRGGLGETMAHSLFALVPLLVAASVCRAPEPRHRKAWVWAANRA